MDGWMDAQMDGHKADSWVVYTSVPVLVVNVSILVSQ